MLIYPAIDLKDGVCVRLMHGRFDQVTRYDEQPAARLTAFVAEGAEWIHVVDLDGAEAGEARQHGLIGELTQAIDVNIQSGGGVRGANDVAKLLDAGVSRVVVGSLAVTQPNDVAAWLKGYGVERITLALDVKIEDGAPVPALKGWTQSSGVTLWDALDRYPEGTAKHILVTDVGRDGETPVTNDYKERDNAFTGKILKVTVDVKPVGAAVKAEADAAQHETEVKKALSN